MNKAAINLSVLSALAIGACAISPDAAGPATQRSRDCFFARSLRDWRPLDDQNIVVFADGRRPHHVVLVVPMPGLSRNLGIGLYDRDGRICPGDAVVARNVLPDRVAIRSITRLSDEELEALYVRFGLEPAAPVEMREIELETDEPGTEASGASAD